MKPPQPAASPRVSVIIPFLNTPDALELCLASLAPQQLDHGQAEIIVIDNGSTVPFDHVRAAWPALRFLHEPAAGPGPARNTGVAAARAPVLAFIDADCRAAPGWLQAAVDAVESDRATPFGGDIRIDFATPTQPTAIEAFEAVFGFRQKVYIEKKHFSVTANLAVARVLFDRIGPFAGINTAEDLDWGRRAAAAGHPTRYCPAMRVWHPARSDFASLRHKWHRLVRHEWNAHIAAGRPAWRWRLRALALVLAVPIESVKLFTSDRISGFTTRLSGVAVLARIRWFRCAEMQRLAGDGAEAAAGFWNSAA